MAASIGAADTTDASFLVGFRVAVAAAVLWSTVELHAKGLIETTYVERPIHFTYPGFDFVRPWPAAGMRAELAGIAVCAALALANVARRAAAGLMTLGLVHVFLVEKAVYLNHTYLIALLALLTAVLPNDRWGRARVPAWTLGLLRFQVAVPYLFGGLAKLNADWLAGQPMQMWNAIGVWRVLLGDVAGERWFALLFAWGGATFDLAIVPLLLAKRTRAVAYGLCVAFHLLNAFMFDIGVFPWLMIAVTTVFFEPDWPKRLLNSARPIEPIAWRWPTGIAGKALAVHVAIQVLVPLRVWLSPGDPSWTEDGVPFSWRMMLRAKVHALQVVIVDRERKTAAPADVARWLTAQQFESMGYDPDMMRQFAHFVREREAEAGRDVAVHVVGWCSLNGRRPQRLIDPRVDLSREPRSWGPTRFVVPLTEPLRDPPWDLPVDQWPRE